MLRRARRWSRFRRQMRAAKRVARVEPKIRASGRALLSYLPHGVGWGEEDPKFNGHTNVWESSQIARELAALGFSVDVVDYRNASYQPIGAYDLVMGIDSRAASLAESAGAEILLLHLTGSYPPFQNEAELRQLRALEERRGARCIPRRQVEDVESFVATITAARACSLLGNDVTLGSYPEAARAKTTCIPVSASTIGAASAGGTAYLWFSGRGAILKGLDVTLEAFAHLRGLRLHVVGPLDDEPDVVEAYREELTRHPNVIVHGLLDPAGARFASVVSDCFALVAPSCSEGTSTAVVTALHLGLVPLITPQTGVSLPAGAGYYLRASTVSDVLASIEYAESLTQDDVAEASSAIRAHARSTYSRPRFAQAVRSYLAASVGA